MFRVFPIVDANKLFSFEFRLIRNNARFESSFFDYLNFRFKLYIYTYIDALLLLKIHNNIFMGNN